MRIKRCLRFQILWFIFSGCVLQNQAVAEAESAVVAVYKFKNGTKPFPLYIEPYMGPSQQIETSKPEEAKSPKTQKTEPNPMEISGPEPRNEPAPKPQPQAEEERVESYHRKTQTRPTILPSDSSGNSVFQEPSTQSTPEPTSSLFNFENLGFIQPAFAKKSDQAEQIIPGKTNPLPHKIFWNQGMRQRSFLVTTIPSDGLCEKGFNPIEIQELDSNQPVKQRCVKQDQPVLIEVSKDEGLIMLNGNITPSWKEEGRVLPTQDEKYLKEKLKKDLEALEEKYAKERETLEQRYTNEKLNLETRYKN